MNQSIISAPGAYPGIPMSQYHRAADLLPGPSLSSSGAKTILEQSPAHYWWDSAMNPERPPENDEPHFSFGKAGHDLLLLGGDWERSYHVLPEGFSRAKTVQFAEQIAAADHAKSKGKTIIKASDMATVKRIAGQISDNPDARNALLRGVPEMTLAWQDDLTGVWLRARPDFLPQSCIDSAPIRIVTDLKFMAGTHCSPRGFSKALDNFGYHLSAAWYSEGIKQVYGKYPTHFMFVVIEKDAPHTVSTYWLEDEDIQRGRLMMRQAINVFAECLKRDQWPGYTTRPMPVGLPIYARMRADEASETDLTKAIWGELEGQAA
jgi:hypothetical protein